VRLPFFFVFNSVIDCPWLFCFAGRLDRRGWTVASVPRDGADGGSANGGGGKVVMIKSKTKRMMDDHERYLDATQRCVGDHSSPIHPSFFLFFCATTLVSLFYWILFLMRLLTPFILFLMTCRGVMRAVQASKFGAPPSNDAGRHSPSLVVEGPRAGAGAGSGLGLSPRALYRLLPQRSERSEGGGAGGVGGASDSGSDTAPASADPSVAGTGTSSSQEYQYQHLRDHPHVQQVRRWGHSLKGHVESLLAD
jgi:hypothetical protein